MNNTIDYSTATAAQKLAEAILRFGIDIKLVRADVPAASGPQLLQILDDARTLISSANELVDAAKAIGNGISVDIFWDRQGWYFVHVDDSTKVSEEFDTMNACARYLVLHGYTINDVRRTRGPAVAPKVPLPPRPVGGE